MTAAITHLTTPIVKDDLSLSFSAFGNGWGFVACKLPLEVALETLHAESTTPTHLVAAFEANRAKIALAIGRHGMSDNGKPIQLNESDF
ncbi:hypothetical protein [Burkholderia diffusa]|uniref:hypothetical protein n=1 Tax=Burkholderia diffusa TaxID=488732 RepID=UPI002ABE95DF|nr:hypothetical protein [Burkholderia diffusa]